MPTKLIAETLLRDINKAERRVRAMAITLRYAQEDSAKAETELQELLAEAKRQGIYFQQNTVTGERKLDPPTKGWD